MINGITIELVSRVQVGVDAFNRPIYDDSIEAVDDVLVGQPTPEDAITVLNLTGRKVTYTLGIPKGDTHIWEGQDVILPPPFAGRYHVVGIPTAGIEEMVPLRWNTKVQVERYG